MVEGLERFKSHFAAYADQYTLIGGAACDLVLDEAGLVFRATKDLDIVLSVEALSTEFVATFWEFIEAGQYEHRYKGTDREQFYRFQKPAKPGFPFMIELFSRQPDALTLAEGSHLTPIPTDETVVSLSAILLNDDYYSFINSGRRVIDGIPIVGAEHLLSLKAKAWCELTERRSRGDSVDSKDIKKHRNDVFRLFRIVDPDFNAKVPTKVREDLTTFVTGIPQDEIDLKVFGIQSQTVGELLGELRRIYGLERTD